MAHGSNRLVMLAAEIKAAHEAAEAATQTAFAKAIEAGRLLIEARAAIPHGGWLAWVRDLGMTVRTAQRYMQLARLPADKSDTVAHLGIRAALAEIAQRATPLEILREVDELLDQAVELHARLPATELERGALLGQSIRLSEQIIDALTLHKKTELAWFREQLPTALAGHLINGTPTERDLARLQRMLEQGEIDVTEVADAADLDAEISAKLAALRQPRSRQRRPDDHLNHERGDPQGRPKKHASSLQSAKPRERDT